MTQTTASGSSLVNVTVQNEFGYDNYANTNTNCPSTSSYILRVPLLESDPTVSRSVLYFTSQAISSGTTALPIRVGFNRRASSPCSALSVVMFDGSQSNPSSSPLPSSLFTILLELFIENKKNPLCPCRRHEFTLLDVHRAVSPVDLQQRAASLANRCHCGLRGCGSDSHCSRHLLAREEAEEIVLLFVFLGKKRKKKKKKRKRKEKENSSFLSPRSNTPSSTWQKAAAL